MNVGRGNVPGGVVLVVTCKHGEHDNIDQGWPADCSMETTTDDKELLNCLATGYLSSERKKIIVTFLCL